MVEDFHRLFDTEEKPFILVGMDLGALVSKFYAQLYQEYVQCLGKNLMELTLTQVN